jgi:AraC family transcriptional regulator of adaptative response / DNA-3-methyladenine glycosylase II
MDLASEVCCRARAARDPRFDGRFFTAVKTTGIYCRPVCPVRAPKESNITYYPSAAAAAEAGYRPCLRCRPEASPGTPAWFGASASVSRALKLIGESALDVSGVDDLATRLGLGARHLRRLFLRYLGAPPVAVAQTRRIHFAKKLIDETDLPMTRVAMASGFGSIRRFNATFQKLYGRAPTGLRKLSARERHADSAGHYIFRLGYRPPYDWNSLVQFLAGRATPGVETVTPDEYSRTISLEGRTGTIVVRPVPSKHYLELQIQFPDPALLFRIVERTRRIFDLGADPAEISDHLRRHARLKPLVLASPGLRLPGCWDGFEIAVRAILGQQVSVKAATTLAGRLAAQFGQELPNGGGRLFPSGEILAKADLNGIGLTQRRTDTIRSLAEAVVKGDVAFDSTLDPEQFEQKITAIAGIGPWTAQYIAMRLGEPDAFPGGDLYLRDLAHEATAWRPWRAYAAMYIWKSAGEAQASGARGQRLGAKRKTAGAIRFTKGARAGK